MNGVQCVCLLTGILKTFKSELVFSNEPELDHDRDPKRAYQERYQRSQSRAARLLVQHVAQSLEWLLEGVAEDISRPPHGDDVLLSEETDEHVEAVEELIEQLREAFNTVESPTA